MSTFTDANAGDGWRAESGGGGETNGRGRVWRRWAGSWRVAGVTLIALCLAVYLPGLWTIPPVDRDECRFAQASRQMFEQAALPLDEQDRRVDASGLPAGMHAGGWVVPMYGTKPRLNKPPLTYWLQVASAAVMTGGKSERDAMWMYRLPSVLSAIGTVLITWRLGLRMFDARAAWLAGVLLAVAPMIVWDAHQARSDQLLTLWTAGAMACLWGVVGRGGGVTADSSTDVKPGLAPRASFKAAVGLWVCVGLGVMTKGFITPLVVLGAVGALCIVKRSLRPLGMTRPVLGLVIVLLVAAPWVWLLSGQVGLDVYAREVWRETFMRAATGAKDGGRVFLPPGVHLVMLIGLFWPGCLLVLPAVGRAVERGWGGGDKVNGKVKVKKGIGAAMRAGWARLKMVRGVARGREVEVFLLAWIVPAWVVFELSPAKLPHYTMPLLPALALLVARFALAAQARLMVGNAAGVWGWFLVGVGLPIAAAAGVWVSDLAPEGRVGALVFVVGLIGIPVWGAMLVVVQLVRGHQWASAMAGAACAGAYGLAMTLHVVVPYLSRVEQPRLLTGNLTERIFTQVRAIDPDGWQRRPIASVWQEDSVVFASRGRVEKIEKGQQEAWLAANPGGILIGTREADASRRDARVLGAQFGWAGFAVLSPVRRTDGSLTPPPAREVRP